MKNIYIVRDIATGTIYAAFSDKVTAEASVSFSIHAVDEARKEEYRKKSEIVEVQLYNVPVHL